MQALLFLRHTLAVARLWQPLPAGWDTGAPLPGPGGTLTIPDDVLQHRAVLTLPNGTPFSVVVETYTAAVLDFPPPPLAR